MQMIGQTVSHKIFGDGVITDCSGSRITVRFAEAEKKFVYPDSFAQYLTPKNIAVRNKVTAILDAMNAAKKAKLQTSLKERERESALFNLKITKNSHAVFDIPEKQVNRLFADWSVSTGVYLAGASKGKTRIPDRLKPNSLCLLTCRRNDEPETARRIIGMFMVCDNFLGSYCQDGIITAHPTYRIALNRSMQPLFWRYFADAFKRQRWGNMKFKYFTCPIAEKILFDLASEADDTKDSKNISEFFEYFCRINRIAP